MVDVQTTFSVDFFRSAEVIYRDSNQSMSLQVFCPSQCDDDTTILHHHDLSCNFQAKKSTWATLSSVGLNPEIRTSNFPNLISNSMNRKRTLKDRTLNPIISAYACWEAQRVELRMWAKRASEFYYRYTQWGPKGPTEDVSKASIRILLFIQWGSESDGQAEDWGCELKLKVRRSSPEP